MSVQVDFYLLESNDELSRMKTVCRLAEKVQRLGHKILVLTLDGKQSQMLDALMWTFSQSSFLPHMRVDQIDEDLSTDGSLHTPVLIHHEMLKSAPPVLINLKDEVPESDNMKRVVEIVNQEEHVKVSGRHKYRNYKSRDFTIKTHHLSPK